MQLDEYAALYVRAKHEAEARGRATALLTEGLVTMPGAYVVGNATLAERRREPEFSDLYEVRIYPSPVGL